MISTTPVELCPFDFANKIETIEMNSLMLLIDVRVDWAPMLPTI